MVELWDSWSEDDLRRDHEETMNSVLPLLSNLQAFAPTLENHMRKLEGIRKDGNKLFAKKDWGGALERYSHCIALSFDVRPLVNNNVIFNQFNRNLMLAYSNRAEARLRLRDYENALADADNALYIEPKHVKTLVRKGKAAHELAFFGKASEAFKVACEESPEDQFILKSLRDSTIAYEQSQNGIYDLTDFFLKGCTGEIPTCADFVGPVEIRRAHSVRGGRGLFATKSLEPGELLLVSNPLAVVRENDPDGSHKHRVLTDLTEELERRILRSKREMARLYSLASNGEHEMRIPSMDLFRPGTEWVASGEEKSEVDMDFIYDEILCKKRFEYVENEGPKGSYLDAAEVSTGIWILPAFANHSCAPNCQSSFVGGTIFLRAFGHIIQGEELTVRYFDTLFEDVKCRQICSQNWMFTCKCQRCLFEESLKPQLSKISKVYPATKIMSFQTLGQKPKRSGMKAVIESELSTTLSILELSKAADEVEALILYRGNSLLPNQQNWIRAAFIVPYMARLKLAWTKLDFPSVVASLNLVLDSMTSIGVTPLALKLAPVLLSAVKDNYTKDHQFYSETMDRVLGIYRVYYGNQPDIALYTLIKGHMPPFAELNIIEK